MFSPLFWLGVTELEERMKGFRCEGCGWISTVKRVVCPRCGGKKFQEVYLSGECRLLTFTRLYAVSEGVKDMPLTLGMVEFDNGARVLGQITSEKVSVGMKLRLAWGLLRVVDGKKIYGFKFEPEN